MEYALKVNLMTSNEVINAEQKIKHKIMENACVSRLLKSTNMHTQWCTDVRVTNWDLQISKKWKPLAKNTDWKNI